MKFENTSSYKKAYQKLSTQDKTRVDKALKILSNNPLHPSLNTEKVAKDIWSIRISDRLRLTFGWAGDTTSIKEANPILLRNVGYHDKVYKSP
jgi:mRNA-degrading endonuclease RelE of RelBE toxin-antitoxin system